MHHPPYPPPGQGHQLQPEIHQQQQQLPHQNPYSQHAMHQLPPVPPMGAQYAENPQMGASQPAPPGSSDGTQQSGPGQDRAPLTPEQKRQQEQNLIPYSSTDGNGRQYSLVVVQQPQRARMCGFGDKDRRPITPPPCVKLVVRDVKTGKEIDCNHIEHTMYVLNVDLWSEDAIKEVNLVRHTTATPSISSTTPASYAAIEQSTPAYSHILPSNRDVSGYPQPMAYQSPQSAVNPYAMQSPYSAGGYGSPNGASYAPPNQFYPDFRPELQGMPQMPPQTPPYGAPPRNVYDQGYMNHPRLSISGNQPQGMFTRNLIGSLAASAFRLTDTDDKIGIWFVLQDLSVRTEGNFRLRFSFVNVGAPGALPSGNSSSAVNTGRAPVLASVFSDTFQVYSAKKFPGVCESTALSKCFATQGIKIPIRKEGGNAKGGRDDDDDGDY
ncbi:velvet factor-domain-containing protein [Apodospora peruviana]|uniref:Velvet factor-domain-containing protein n=1 Tax=Apodospora peruviana TaxID=516989 RepID=A0AAE0ME14_9PEZI|nr:velvet factor-domain-containing protein [Apodospora peruviana]